MYYSTLQHYIYKSIICIYIYTYTNIYIHTSLSSILFSRSWSAMALPWWRAKPLLQTWPRTSKRWPRPCAGRSGCSRGLAEFLACFEGFKEMGLLFFLENFGGCDQMIQLSSMIDFGWLNRCVIQTRCCC